MPLGALEAQHECPVCFQKFSSDAISIHCDTHFAVDSLAPDNTQDDEVVVVEAPRPQPVTHNRRSAYVPQRTQAPTSSATVAREPQDLQSPDLSPLLCRSLAAQATGQAHVTGDACAACAYLLGLTASQHFQEQQWLSGSCCHANTLANLVWYRLLSPFSHSER